MPVFTDTHLARLASYERETRASADVDAITAFPDFWREKLITIRTYIIICQESLTGNDGDAFRAKLSAYEKEWASTLPLAQAAALAAGETVAVAAPALSVSFGR